jgi:hypothetical protein
MMIWCWDNLITRVAGGVGEDAIETALSCSFRRVAALSLWLVLINRLHYNILTHLLSLSSLSLSLSLSFALFF